MSDTPLHPDVETNDPQSGEPIGGIDLSERGLSVSEFKSPGVWNAVKESIGLLQPAKRTLLIVAAVIQISLGLLDLLGIALVGLVAAVAVSGIGSSGLPSWAESILSTFGLGGLTVSQLSIGIAGAAVAILVLKTVLSAVLSRRITYFLANRQAEVSADLASRFLRRPLSDVQRWTTSEATYALSSGVGAATVTLLSNGITIAAEVFLFSIVGISLLIFDPLLTISAGVFFGVIVFFLHRVLGNWTERNARVTTETSINTLTTVSEALATYREAMVLNRRDLYVDRYESLVHRAARANASNTFLVEVPKYVLESALYLGILMLAAVQFVTKDWSAAASTVAVFLAAGSRITPALLRLQGAGITIRNAAIQAQPTFFMSRYLDSLAPEEQNSNSVRVSAERIRDQIRSGYPDFDATICIDRATLTYPGANLPALLNASLNATLGTSIALVGATGAGKSTLADVILGVLEPDTGEVSIGGISPKHAIERWPGAITYVPQFVALVAGTVRENVALGLPAEFVDDDLVIEALRRAHIGDFLAESREGLDTFIGERGFRLSGGQRQRLGIARALYTRPQLLVLDEATSALDSETEQAIIATLEELEGEVTTITVAHRLATVRRADQILYLKDGIVLATGTFEEVRAQVHDFDRQASLLGL